MKRWHLLPIPLALVGLAAAPVPWEELTPADLVYEAMTRVARIEGHEVHYPTPTAELARLLEGRTEPEAQRQLAETRFALGDRAGALRALEAWAVAAGPAAWHEAARWAAARLEMAFAFRAAERALAGLDADAKRALLGERIAWAERHPDLADALALRGERAAALPDDGTALEDWFLALEKAGRYDEAEQALSETSALDPERRVLLRSDLLADRKDARRAFEVLDAIVEAPGSLELRQAYARRVDAWNRDLPDAWRGRLERRFDAPALVRLTTYFQGQGRGDKAALLLQQVERRYESGFDREGFRLLSRLHGELGAIPEAFRSALATSQLGSEDERTGDLPHLVRFALRAGSRPLAWGHYDDEAYRWLARVDRTPGFWTGGLSFLLTGQDWKEALARLETAALPDRTFETAQLLVAELERRAPRHEDLQELRVHLMERHVERGDGKKALDLLARVEHGATPRVADEARRVALLAVRQVEVTLDEEVRLFGARLRHLAPDGSRPSLQAAPYWQPEWSDDGHAGESRPWRRPRAYGTPAYREVLQEAQSRLDQRDGSHRTSVSLFLAELDRLPDAESLWLDLARRLEAWNLDDELGPRYERALQRFSGPEWWARAARFYARRSRTADLGRLASDLSARFRGSELFERAGAMDVRLELPDQPKVGERVRLFPFADLVRLQALERFPHSPLVVREALGRLERRSRFDERLARLGPVRWKAADDRVVVDDALLDRKLWAALFADPQRREEYFAAKMRAGSLEQDLVALENSAQRGPVEDRLLFEGWARLARFEAAAPHAERLAAAYPGDPDTAQSALALFRSLAGLDPAQAARAQALVARSGPAVVDPAPLFTELGELLEERGDPAAALLAWRPILEREPRNPERVRELSTLMWDYAHMPEALEVLEGGRRRLGRPRFMAFEAGVLREETRDIDGAVREYLAALEPEEGGCYCSSFEEDQRSLRRLSQLLGRERVLEAVARRIEVLRPGVAPDEEALAAFLPLATITPPTPGHAFDADDWIDAMDMPRDPVGRAEREAARESARPGEQQALARIAEVLLAQAEAMTPHASAREFLDALERWAVPLLEERDVERMVSYQVAVLERRSAMAPSPEERLSREVERARFLVERGRREQADALWAALAVRVRSLPEGAPRLRAEADYAAYLERSRGLEAAAAEWQALTRRYPWSLGIFEDHLAFLARAGRDAESRSLLESTAPQAGDGRREQLLDRLVRASLQGHDLPRARRAVERLLGEKRLDEARRLGALHLLARLRLQEDPAFDPLGLARSEAALFRAQLQPDLYAQLAQAADAEQAWASSLTLWIEALNRRLERGWLARAARSADRAGRAATLREFFERQQQRSPRDVRWAVAVRELRRHQDDAEGAVAMAKAATAVRPERESLWREAADLLVRADRVAEAADFLEGWNRPRPGDEGVAAWRGSLYARAGNASRALEIEGKALEAFESEAPLDKERREELQGRRGRAARRLLSYGLPDLAWRLVTPTGDISSLAQSGLDADGQAELALAAGRFASFLKAVKAGPAMEAAGRVFQNRARTEDQDALRALVQGALWPATGPSPAGLRRYWPFVQNSGLEPVVRQGLAHRHLAAHPGAWTAEIPISFLEEVGDLVVEQKADAKGQSRWLFAAPSLHRLWVKDLVRRDRAADLAAVLAPRLRDAMTMAASSEPLPASDVALLDWAAWLDRDALEVWARGLREDPAVVAQLSKLFSSRRSWDRFWALVARQWNTAPLVSLLSDDARAAWFRFWAPGPRTEDPKRVTVAQVQRAVGRLVAGEPAAADDPVIAKLRGPRRVGEVLAAEARWTFVELGSATPEALWGGRPGEGFWALETLASVGLGEPNAALLPLEFPERGRENERVLLGAAIAERQGDAGLALEILDARAGADATLLERTLRLLVKTGAVSDAQGRFSAHVRQKQPSLEEAGLRGLEALAEALGLAPPLESFAPETPLRPALLAYLHDNRGAANARRFGTDDEAGFRAALATRFSAREASLDAAQVRYWLFELWARGASEFPSRGLRRLGGLFPHAGAWLAPQLVADRALALAAVDALPDAGPLHAFASARADATSERFRLLALRAALHRGDDAAAVALLDGLLAELRGVRPLTWEPVAVELPEEEGEEWPEEGLAPESDEGTTHDGRDLDVARLEAWLLTFREAGKQALAEGRAAELLGERRAEGPASTDAWRLALRLAPDAAARAALDRDLEHAWLRGDIAPEALGPIVDALSRHAPELARRWLARWPEDPSLQTTSARAAALQRLGDPNGAAATLTRARLRRGFEAAEDVRAFDQWRRLGPQPAAEAPSAWGAALRFWTAPAADAAATLAEHLAAHPADLLAGRAALRSLGPAPESALRRALLALRSPALQQLGSPWTDARVVRLRLLRSLLPGSARAARVAFGAAAPSDFGTELDARRFPRRDVDAALSDLARAAAGAGSQAEAQSILAALADRRARGLVELRASVGAAAAPEAPRSFRLADGQPAPWLPRDLTWRVVADVLAAEAAP